MKPKFAVLALLTLGIVPLSHIGWCNGETFLEVRDPRTGVVLPLQRTPVRVEREQLEITLERYDIPGDLREVALDYHVRATYWLHNPTDKEQVLKVAFPIPGGVFLRRSPVRLDDQLVDWERLDTTEFLELHRPQIQKVLNQVLEKRKTLRTVMDKALAEFKKRPRSAQSSPVEELHSLISWEMIEPIKSQLQQEI